jgi:hypothetical protein
VTDYYFSEIKFKLKEDRHEYGTYQLIIKEKMGQRKKLGKTHLIEASEFAKHGYIPLNKYKQNFHYFSCKTNSSVEITFKSKNNLYKTKVIIDFEHNYIEFPPYKSPSNKNTEITCSMLPTFEEIQTIMESIYIGGQQMFTFFIAGGKLK